MKTYKNQDLDLTKAATALDAVLLDKRGQDQSRQGQRQKGRKAVEIVRKGTTTTEASASRSSGVVVLGTGLSGPQSGPAPQDVS